MGAATFHGTCFLKKEYLKASQLLNNLLMSISVGTRMTTLVEWDLLSLMCCMLGPKVSLGGTRDLSWGGHTVLCNYTGKCCFNAFLEFCDCSSSVPRAQPTCIHPFSLGCPPSSDIIGLAETAGCYHFHKSNSVILAVFEHLKIEFPLIIALHSTASPRRWWQSSNLVAWK